MVDKWNQLLIPYKQFKYYFGTTVKIQTQAVLLHQIVSYKY